MTKTILIVFFDTRCIMPTCS